MNRPNLFIAGAPKSGTTFLYHNLKRHSRIFFPIIKELNFFSHDLLDQYEMYYRDFRVRDEAKYLEYFKGASSETYLVDASVSYFTFESLPERIKAFNPSAKIIFILRNPVKRAFSHYMMDARMGYASEEFGEYLRNNDLFPAHYLQYIGNSLYAKNIHNFLEVFDKTDVCILILEEIESEWPRLMDFLGLDMETEKIDLSTRINERQKPINAFARYFLNNRNFASKLKLHLPKSLIDKSKKYLYKPEKPTKLAAADKEYLERILAADVKCLSQLASKDLNQLWNIF